MIKLVPYSLLSSLADKVCKADLDSRSPYDLSLFFAVTHTGDFNIKENQLEIMRFLTSPGRLEQVASFFIPVNHPDYSAKREMMAPFIDKNEVALEDLPTPLAYHLMIVDVLCRCTVGRFHLTTVEAKVQSIFKCEDVLDSIVDSGTILLFKTHLSLFVYYTMIDVEMPIPGFEYLPNIWNLFQSLTTLFTFAKDDIRLAEKLGWESPNVCRQKSEFLIASVMIIWGFFTLYFNKNKFRLHDSANVFSASLKITMSEIHELIQFFFQKDQRYL